MMTIEDETVLCNNFQNKNSYAKVCCGRRCLKSNLNAGKPLQVKEKYY